MQMKSTVIWVSDVNLENRILTWRLASSWFRRSTRSGVLSCTWCGLAAFCANRRAISAARVFSVNFPSLVSILCLLYSSAWSKACVAFREPGICQELVTWALCSLTSKVRVENVHFNKSKTFLALPDLSSKFEAVLAKLKQLQVELKQNFKGLIFTTLKVGCVQSLF